MKSLNRLQGCVAVLVALSACGPEKDESTGSPTGSSSTGSSTTGATSSTTTVEEPTTTAAMTGTGGASEGSTGMNGVCPDEIRPGAEETCASETDPQGCASSELSSGGCLWIPWFPVNMVEGTCSFGDPRGQCVFLPCSEEGCAELSPCGPEGFGGAFIVDESDAVSVGFANWCLSPPSPAQACLFDFEGQLIDGPPECACLCDPAFPGG